MSKLFTPVGADQVVTITRGVYKQGQLFEREKHLYVKCSGGFVMLHCDGGTSAPHTRWIYIDTEASYEPNSLGRLVWVPKPEPGKARKHLRRVV